MKSGTGLFDVRRLGRGFLALVPAALLFSACDTRGCRPTTTTVRSSAAADLRDPRSSSMLFATVRSGRRALNHEEVHFFLQRRRGVVTGSQESVGVGRSYTMANGVATFDLKSLPAPELARDSFADTAYAIFDGDETYCASRGSAPYRLVASPVGPAASARIGATGARPRGSTHDASEPPSFFLPLPVPESRLIPRVSLRVPIDPTGSTIA